MAIELTAAGLEVVDYDVDLEGRTISILLRAPTDELVRIEIEEASDEMLTAVEGGINALRTAVTDLVVTLDAV